MEVSIKGKKVNWVIKVFEKEEMNIRIKGIS